MKRLKKYTLIGIVFVLITGTLSHFIYQWSGENYAVGFFFPVNESTWEHMKLVFFPMLLYACYISRKLRISFPCIGSALSLGILSGTALIPAVFYIYTGILGENLFVLDILTFILSVLIAFFLVFRFTISCKTKEFTSLLYSILLILLICFLLFTYHPPHIGLFANPV